MSMSGSQITRIAPGGPGMAYAGFTAKEAAAVIEGWLSGTIVAIPALSASTASSPALSASTASSPALSGTVKVNNI